MVDSMRNHRDRRFREYALTMLLLAACSSGSRTADVTPGPARSPTVPTAVDDVTAAGTQRFPSAQLGTLYRYARGDFKPDVFLYAKSGWRDSQSQAQTFIETLDISRRRGEFESYQILLNQAITVTAGARSLPGHEVIFRMTRRNEVRESYFAVVALDDEYVKFRITQAVDATATARAREFARRWVALYVGEPPT